MGSAVGTGPPPVTGWGDTSTSKVLVKLTSPFRCGHTAIFPCHGSVVFVM